MAEGFPSVNLATTQLSSIYPLTIHQVFKELAETLVGYSGIGTIAAVAALATTLFRM